MLTGYYQKNKESPQRFSKKGKNRKLQYPREQYRNTSEGEKNKKHQYGHQRYKNLPEDEKQSLVEYRKKYSRMQKITYNAKIKTSL